MSGEYVAHKGLVVTIVRRFTSRYGYHHLFQEFYSEACLFFVKAIRTYNPAKGKKSTWIAFQITVGLQEYSQQLTRQGEWHQELHEYMLAYRRPPQLPNQDSHRWRQLNSDGRILIDLIMWPLNDTHRKKLPGHRWEYALALLMEADWDARRIEAAYRHVQSIFGGEGDPPQAERRPNHHDQTARREVPRPISGGYGHGTRQNGDRCEVAAAMA